MQAGSLENSLEIWKLQQTLPHVVSSIGNDTEASRNIEEQEKIVIEQNNQLIDDLSSAINEVCSIFVVSYCFDFYHFILFLYN